MEKLVPECELGGGAEGVRRQLASTKREEIHYLVTPKLTSLYVMSS